MDACIMKQFDKPYRSLHDLVDLLISRGMVIDSRQSAVDVLRHINNYRLRAYWLPFEADAVSHQFLDGTSFARTVEIYQFDRDLRASIMRIVERIEVSIRAQIAREYAREYGSHGHDNRDIAYSDEHWIKAMSMLHADLTKSKDTFVSHFNKTYVERTPPIWAVVEILSFGSLSYWFAKVVPRIIQHRVGGVYHTHPDILSSWLHHISVVRNIVAHHGRLWNRVTPFQPRIPKPERHTIASSINPKTNRLYNSLTILQYLNNVICHDNVWSNELHDLFLKHRIDSQLMGFPVNWHDLPVWRGGS